MKIDWEKMSSFPGCVEIEEIEPTKITAFDREHPCPTQYNRKIKTLFRRTWRFPGSLAWKRHNKILIRHLELFSVGPKGTFSIGHGDHYCEDFIFYTETVEEAEEIWQEAQKRAKHSILHDRKRMDYVRYVYSMMTLRGTIYKLKEK